MWMPVDGGCAACVQMRLILKLLNSLLLGVVQKDFSKCMKSQYNQDHWHNLYLFASDSNATIIITRTWVYDDYKTHIMT